MRGRGLERAALYSRPAWREKLATLVEDILHYPPRARNDQVEVIPRTESLNVAAGQGKILVHLKDVFKAIIKDGAPFPTYDYLLATRGRCILEEWSSICEAAGGGIIIAVGGKMSAGKSSIINAMLGQSLLPTASTSTFPYQCND